jgi:hypothetical protein
MEKYITEQLEQCDIAPIGGNNVGKAVSLAVGF